MARPWPAIGGIVGGIVVGYDGSPSGRAALRWARQEAATHGRTLHVVRAWTLGSAVLVVGAPPGIVPSLTECAAAVRTDTERALAALRAEDGRHTGPDTGAGISEPEACLHIVHGPAAEALIAASESADLVVVAHHAHPVLTRVLGSVTLRVLDRARCPVVVLPVR